MQWSTYYGGNSIKKYILCILLNKWSERGKKKKTIAYMKAIP